MSFPIGTRFGNKPLVAKGLANKEYVDSKILTAIKTSTQTITNIDTLFDDSELFVPTLRMQNYGFYFLGLIKSHATPDFKCDFNVPVGSSASRLIGSGGTVAVSTIGIANDLVVTTDDTNQAIIITGSLRNGNEDGIFQFRWAQNVSDGNSTQLLDGSALLVWSK